MDYSNCPNCNAEINNSGFVKIGNKIVHANPDKFHFIKKYSPTIADTFCDKCVSGIKDRAFNNYFKKVKEEKENLQALIEFMPIVNIQNPLNWDYETAGIVTAQYVTGTGFITEIKADFSDFLGRESKKMNSRISMGEKQCFLRMQNAAAALGGNAIVGVDIDYAEMGSIKNMIMVCTTGTAVRLKNPEVAGRNMEYVKNLEHSVDIVNELILDDPYKKVND